jgi:hypothetical protein
VLTAAVIGVVRQWDVESGKLLLTLLDHARHVMTARLTGDGTRILTAGLVGKDAEGWKTARVIVYDDRPVNRAFIRPDLSTCRGMPGLMRPPVTAEATARP